MGIQSTINLTREKAEKEAFSRWLKEQSKFFMLQLQVMSDEQLEDYLEEEFYNYSIYEED